MTKWWTISFILLIVALVLFSRTDQQRMKKYYAQYRMVKNPILRSKVIDQAKPFMSTKRLPYILEEYRNEGDIQFTVAMIAISHTGEDNAILRKTIREKPPGHPIRLICMAQLLGRGTFEIWDEITEEDIERIAISMPVHIVHWRYLILQYSGRSSWFLRNDTYPERRWFKALFKECIKKYDDSKLPVET